MDNNKILKLLTDILNAIHEIEEYTANEIHPNKKEFLNIPAQRVAERNLEIIGEAINNLIKLDANIAITDKRKIVNLRNKLIHDYDGIDPQLIIPVIDVKLDKLKSEIRALINQFTNSQTLQLIN